MQKSSFPIVQPSNTNLYKAWTRLVCLSGDFVACENCALSHKNSLLQDWCCCCYGHCFQVEVASVGYFFFFFDKTLTFIYLYVCTYLNQVRRQLMEVSFHQMGPPDWTQAIRPYSKGLYLLTFSVILIFFVLWLVGCFSINGDTLADRLWKFINAFYSQLCQIESYFSFLTKSVSAFYIMHVINILTILQLSCGVNWPGGLDIIMFKE